MKPLLIFILSAILVVYSSEMTFMPYYSDRPDKWHLAFPMLFVNLGLLIIFIKIVIEFLKKGRFLWKEFVIVISTFVVFIPLNSPDNKSQETSFYILSAILIITVVAHRMDIKKANIKKHN